MTTLKTPKTPKKQTSKKKPSDDLDLFRAAIRKLLPLIEAAIARDLQMPESGDDASRQQAVGRIANARIGLAPVFVMLAELSIKLSEPHAEMPEETVPQAQKFSDIDVALVRDFLKRSQPEIQA